MLFLLEILDSTVNDAEVVRLRKGRAGNNKIRACKNCSNRLKAAVKEQRVLETRDYLLFPCFWERIVCVWDGPLAEGAFVSEHCRRRTISGLGPSVEAGATKSGAYFCWRADSC